MSYYFKNIKPTYASDDEDNLNENEDELSRIIRNRNKTAKKSKTANSDDDDDDELQTLSFGALKKADAILDEEETKEEKNNRPAPRERERGRSFKEEQFEAESESDNSDQNVSDEDSGSDIGFFEEDEQEHNNNRSRRGNNGKQTRHKHAPSEQSAKKRVPRIRQIEGLGHKGLQSTLYQDVRFDKSLGRATDQDIIRRRYEFLDEYREKEIAELDSMLHDRKFMSKVTDYDRGDMENRLTSMKSKLQTVKNQDLEKNVIKEYENKINDGNTSRYHLKKSEKRKVIQKWKFDHMKGKQREKVMERKRKKRLGKEFRQFEFHQNRG